MKTAVSLALQEDSGFSPFPAAHFAEGVAWAGELGVDAAELIILDPNQVDADALLALLGKHNLAVATLATGQMAGKGLYFCSPDASARESSVKRICDHIDLSTRIGKPNVTIGLARGKGSDDASQRQIEYNRILECVRRCGAYAAEKDVVINLEPLNRYETYYLHSSGETVEMIEKADCPSHVGVLYDTFHSNIEDADMAATVERHIKNIVHVHFADSNRMTPGSGHTDFTAVANVLRKHNYKGYVSLEVLNAPDAAFVRNNASAFVSLAR